MKTLLSAAACVVVLVSAPAFASKDLATAKGCLGCHSQGSNTVIGPGYQAVAKKYAGQKDAEGKVAAYIRAGSPAGTGTAGGPKTMWGGPMPMPANPGVSEAEAKTLAAWILGGAK
ncbi:MAG: c-type cytochrome [Gammaproteobacteria bacterium]|jgi:cytochrome c|nr:c-type cytochrome [Gammaproteobacteria bacterium]MBU0772315.1 c-type cytochrome [Gammaproteobacteria bacterium]MBU0857926.1 c-type cytochrome [Gammaproteobacteria bacterium]MBU1848442.1 c-type cytochrome [Gammaproteobacteria bacterium]